MTTQFTKTAHIFRNSPEGWIYKGELSTDGSTTFGELMEGDKASFDHPSEDSDCEQMEDAAGFFA